MSIAPGRVNLIGEHTDYNEGFVFPAAIDRYILAASRPTTNQSTMVSRSLGAAQPFDVNLVNPGEVTGWAVYPAGVAWALRQSTGVNLPNLESAVDSKLTAESGLSSSAALELAFAVTWNEAAGLGLSNTQLARICQTAENEFVGVKCGIMDQMACALGKAGHAIFIDTKSLDTTYALIPEDLSLVICDTGQPRTLAGSAYNERRLQCEQACAALSVKSLRNARLHDLESRWSEMSETVYKRAHHVITENARCISFVDALDKRNLLKIGLLMRASHESLRDHYEVSSPHLDFMAEAAWDAPGCVGARMTGAGFGGACIALVEESRVEAFIHSTEARFALKSGTEGSFTECRAARGAHILKRVT